MDKILSCRGIILLFFLITFPAPSFIFSQTTGYFQQEVNYEISVSLDDNRHELIAFESIQYVNKSPDDLKFLYFHLWPNGYSGNKTALALQLALKLGRQKLFSNGYSRGFIDSLDFKVNDVQIKWNYVDNQPDICILYLPHPLKSGDTILISTPFRVKIPGGAISRAGHTGQSYQISQWFPKPAVYDKHGWHQMSYLDQGEFYSDYGRFYVNITLPANYIVGATGELMDQDEIEWLDAIASDTSWMTRQYYGTSLPSRRGQLKTLHFARENIHDFAWFADRNFHILKEKIELPASRNKITAYMLFRDEQSHLWRNAPEYVGRAIRFFSEKIGDYPYKTFTAIQTSLAAGAGMEYPGVAVIGSAEDAYSLDEVIAHEICHNWFYGAIGSDERRFPFMDESITSAYDIMYTSNYYPAQKLWEVYFRNPKMARFFGIMDLPVQRMPEIEWLVQARNNLEQQVNLPSQDFTEMNYNNIIYFKAAQGFLHLRSYLGDEVFDSIMHDYYSKWNGKHPYPSDLQEIFEHHTEKNLDWFFGDFNGTLKRIDYKASQFKDNNLVVKNIGEMSPPFTVSALSGDSVVSTTWSEGFRGEKTISIPGHNITRAVINKDHTIPELNYLNNGIKSNGIFSKADPVHLQLLFSFEDPEKRSLVYTPLLNWNRINGLMIGLALNNGFLLPKPFEYSVMPFFSFRKNDITGRGRIAYNITPYDNFIRKATISVEGSQFGASDQLNYHTLKTGLDLYFRNSDLNNRLNHKAFARVISASDLYQIDIVEKAGANLYWQLGYTLDRSTVVNPFTFQTSLETDGKYQKTAAEIKYRISYYGTNNGLDIRMYSGFMSGRKPEFDYFNIAPAGRSGRELYLFQGEFPDRFPVFPETFWSRQMVLSEGGLISPVNDSLGYSRWLFSASFSSSLPGKAGKAPVKPFINLLYNDHGSNRFFYEAGLKAGIWGFFEIHIPLLVSDNIGSINSSIKSRIRFILNLNVFQPLRVATGRSD
jgi:hypothetical protein